MSDLVTVAGETPKTFDAVNVGYGAAVGFLSLAFGQYWVLFAGFLALNVVDFLTGCYKAKLTHELSSAAGFAGAMRKVFYWVVIGIAFFISRSFGLMGEAIGVNLSFVSLFGWLTLATYIVNEIRSILENLVEVGVEVPDFLVRGLGVTKKLMEARDGKEGEDGKKMHD